MNAKQLLTDVITHLPIEQLHKLPADLLMQIAAFMTAGEKK